MAETAAVPPTSQQAAPKASTAQAPGPAAVLPTSGSPASSAPVQDGLKQKLLGLVARLGARFKRKSSATGDQPETSPSQDEQGQKVPLGTRIKTALGFFGESFKEINHGFVAPDPKTRRMVGVFWINVFCATLVLGLGVRQIASLFGPTAAEIEAARVAEELRLQKEEAQRQKEALFNMGTFTIELKYAPGQEKHPGLMNVAEIEIVAECDTGETCSYIEEHLMRARDEMTNVFVPIDRQELLSKNGKRELKQNLIDAINRWLPSGTVRNVHFMKLVVT